MTPTPSVGQTEHSVSVALLDALWEAPIGLALLDQGRFREAADSFALAMRLDPGLRAASVGLARAREQIAREAGTSAPPRP